MEYEIRELKIVPTASGGLSIEFSRQEVAWMKRAARFLLSLVGR